jgi:ADP-dependent NAD(P)H-hydrate dehydratase / NAD(P)H-hydrate epimerase
VVVASPRSDLVSAAAPELLNLSIGGAEASLDRFDVVIVGPGLAAADLDEALSIVRQAPRLVLDAGALVPEVVGLAREAEAEVVVTPHAGEFERIAGVGSGQYSARAYALSHGLVVLLKGNPTTVMDGSSPVLVRTGGAELATIGTGDVLAGMIGALWSRGLDARTAAVSAAYWHGVAAADLAQQTTVTADSLANHVGEFAFPHSNRGGRPDAAQMNDGVA